MKKVVITHAKRTPIGKFLGSFSNLTAVDLGVSVTTGLLKESGLDPQLVDEFVFGNARQAGSGPNPARQVSIRSGIPQETPSLTVNKACGSSIRSIIDAYRAIVLDEADIVIAGGTESMTNVPFLLDGARMGYRLGHAKLYDGMYRDGFHCPLADQLMGATAENIAERYSIGRPEQDEYAVMSQNRCEAARKSGRFDDEMSPVTIKDRKGNETLFSTDEHARDGMTAEKMAKLPAVFKKDGSVHAGNSSGITDGAAALLVMSEEKAKELKYKPMAAITAYTAVGVDPKYMGMGPVPAVNKLLARTGMQLGDFDLVELNEAFAAQVLGVLRKLPFDMERLNVNGGAIALGHPIAATGARMVATLLHEMVRSDVHRGLATLCISGGLGMAISFER